MIKKPSSSLLKMNRHHILFLSYCPPTPSWGGSMTFYRHFIERNDFETLVITNDNEVDKYDIPYKPTKVNYNKLWEMSQTWFQEQINRIEDSPKLQANFRLRCHKLQTPSSLINKLRRKIFK